MCIFAWPCFPVLEVDVSTTLQGRPKKNKKENEKKNNEKDQETFHRDVPALLNITDGAWSAESGIGITSGVIFIIFIVSHCQFEKCVDGCVI
jgi:hypothetical protein